MLETLTAILVVSAIAAALAAVLVAADAFILNYGECEILINGEKTLKVQGGSSLLESLSSNKLFVPSACGGRGTCGYCKLKVLDGAGPLLPTEEPYLTPEEKSGGVRLSCQVKVRNNLSIEVPDELFSVKQYQGVCTRIRDLTHDIKEFRMELRDPPTIDYTPGQYIQLFCPSYDGNEEVYRAYSISSDPAEKNAVELIIRLVPNGICTTWCFNHLKEGDPVRLNGAYGDFRLSDTDAPMVFMAGGSGMAPIKCLLHQMRNTGNTREAVYFFGANLVAELVLDDEMRQFEKDLTHFTYVPVVTKPEPDSGWQGETGLVTEALGRKMKDASQHEAYLCGSPGMIKASQAMLTKLGMPEDKIYFDSFA